MSRRLIGLWCLVLVALTGAAAPAGARSSGTGSPPAALGCDPNGDRWAQTITGGGSETVSADPFGSMLTTPGQDLAHAEAYDPYGTAENPSVAPGATLGYRGELTLSGTVSLRARDYDPTTGVFHSLDPLDDVAGTPTSGNAYHYGYNDPLNRVDPTGMRPDDCAFRVFGACQDRDDFIKGATFVASTGFGLACGTAVLGATSLTGPAAAMLAGGAANTCAGSMHRAITRYAYGNNAAKAPWDPQALTTDAATGIATAGAFHYGGQTLRTGITRYHTRPRGQIGNNIGKATPTATNSGSGASSAANGARLSEQLRLTERYGVGGVRELADGRIRFYGELTPAKAPGEMAGARLVREWNPTSGAQRTWYETVDQAGNVRIVRPETGGPKVHQTFDADGNYTGSR